MLAILLVAIVPCAIVLGCCLWRAWRRRAAKQQQQSTRKSKKDKSARSDGRGEDVPLFTEKSPLAASASFSASTTQSADEPPVEPVVLNPAFLPVDAYHGVPPKRYVL